MNNDISENLKQAKASTQKDEVQIIFLEEILQKVNVLQLELLLYTDFCQRYSTGFKEIKIPKIIQDANQCKKTA